MSSKQEKLSAVSGAANAYTLAQADFWNNERKELILAIREASKSATQLEIAKATGLSRQRVAQLLYADPDQQK